MSTEQRDDLAADMARWKTVFPFLQTDELFAVMRFLVWGVLLGFIDLTLGAFKLLLSGLWISGFVYLYVVRRKRDDRHSGFSTLLARPRATLIVPVTALVLLSAMAAPWGQVLLSGLPDPSASLSEGKDLSPIKIAAAVHVLAFVVLAVTSATYPLLEEFFARGWLFSSLRQRHSAHVTVLITSIVFTILHLTLDPKFVVARFAFGILLGYAVVTTRSIWTSVGMHFAWNTVLAFFKSPATQDIQSAQFLSINPSYRIAWMMIVFCLLASVAVEIVAGKKTAHIQLAR